MQRNKLLSEIKPSTLNILRTYKGDVEFNQHVVSFSKEMEVYKIKESRRIQKIQTLKGLSKKEKEIQI